MKRTLNQAFGSTLKATGRRDIGIVTGKLVAKHASKVVGRALARTAASPWLLTSDVADLAAHKAARALDCDEKTSRTLGKGAGAVTSIVVGAALAGPVGAVAGGVVWGVGEIVGSLFD
ncbi:MAG: hypothetical protein QM765_38870 [Myxococcales bacterium]